MTRNLDGKVAIVTGAAGGIGSATARLFIDQGATVVLADLSILHNNAVTVSAADTDTIGTPNADWQSTWEVVVMAAVHGCRHAIPAMIESGAATTECAGSGEDDMEEAT